MRFALLHTALGRVGGAERQLVRFLEAARAMGADIDVFYTGPTFPQLEALGNRFPPLREAAGPPETYRAYLKLLRTLRDYDSIIVYHHVEPVLLGLVAALQGDRCIAYLGEPLRPLWEHEVSGDRTLISYPEMEKTARQLYGPFVSQLVHHPHAMSAIVRVLRGWDRLSHRRLALITANSQWMSRILQRVYRLRAPPAVVYQGVPALPNPSVRGHLDRVVLSVGAFIPLKDHATLLRAWRTVETSLQDQCPQLVLIGEGPTLPTSKTLAADLGLRRVRFIPRASSEELSDWYGRARLLVHSAIGEPFGMTPVEAAAHRVPSLVSDGGGATEFVLDGACGRTFPARNVRRLSETLIQLLNNPIELERLGQQAFARQRSAFTIHHTVTGLFLWLTDGRPMLGSETETGLRLDAVPPVSPH